MSEQSVANSREKSLGENMLIFSLIAIFMCAFIYYFFKQDEQITQAGFERIANNFSSKVMAIRAQWFMDRQPETVLLKDNGVIEKIKVNKKGWVDFGEQAQNCQKIWHIVISNELTFMNQQVIAIDIHHEANQLKSACRYSLTTGEYFDYHLMSGLVTKVKKNH